jgi:hypothetical protein
MKHTVVGGWRVTETKRLCPTCVGFRHMQYRAPVPFLGNEFCVECGWSPCVRGEVEPSPPTLPNPDQLSFAES